MDADFSTLDFPGLDWGGYSREEVLDLLTEAALDSLDFGGGADFAADQPRVPAGSPEGGQFGPGGGGGGAGGTKAERAKRRAEKEAAVRAKLGPERIATVRQAVADLLPKYQHVALYGQRVKAFDPAVPENDLVRELDRRGLSGAGGHAHRLLDAMVFIGELAKLTTGAGDITRPGMMAHSYRLPQPDDAGFAWDPDDFLDSDPPPTDPAAFFVLAERDGAAAALAAWEEARFGFDPDEERDEKGKWTAGGASGASAPDRPKQTVAERGSKIADAHYQNMRVLLAKFVSGDYSPEDVASDADVYAEEASTASRANFNNRYANFKARVAAEYGPNAVGSGEWDAVRDVFREQRDAAEEHIREMARNVRGIARTYVGRPERTPGVTRSERANLRDSYHELRRAYARFDDRLRVAARDLLDAYDPLPGHAGFSAEEARFYSPDQPRDDRGRWTSGGGGGESDADPFRGGMTHAARSGTRTASAAHARDFVARGGPATNEEVAALGHHLARLTVAQLHALRAEHGLSAAGAWKLRKPDLVRVLGERFAAHRAALPTSAARELAAAVAGKPEFTESKYRPSDATHAYTHQGTGFRASAHPDGRFHVFGKGLTHEGVHDTAAAAVAHAANPPPKPPPDYHRRVADVETAARQGAVADAAARREGANVAHPSGLVPEVVAQHQAPYKGATLDNSHAQEKAGFPKALETLRSWPTEKLQAERRDLVRTSFGGMFGQNARKLLAVVEQVIQERRALESSKPPPAFSAADDAPAERPVRFIPLVQPAEAARA